jgi:hypothetical protein
MTRGYWERGEAREQLLRVCEVKGEMLWDELGGVRRKSWAQVSLEESFFPCKLYHGLIT